MMTLLAVGKIFYSDFGLFYQVTQNSGAIFSTTNTIDTYVYRALTQMGDVGMEHGCEKDKSGKCIILKAVRYEKKKR